MRWKEFWHKKRTQDGTDSRDDCDNEVTESIFKDKTVKTNLHRKHPVPAALSACIATTRYDILGSKLNNIQPNIPPDITAAGKDLVTLQRERFIVIKPNDKMGGVSLMDLKTIRRPWTQSW